MFRRHIETIRFSLFTKKDGKKPSFLLRYFTLRSVVDNFIIVFIDQIFDKNKLISLVFQAFKNCRQGLGGVVGIIVEKHNTAVFNLTCHPLTNTVCRCIFFPVKAINIRYKSNLLIMACANCINMV